MYVHLVMDVHRAQKTEAIQEILAKEYTIPYKEYTTTCSYNPHCQLSIDESMIGTKCRLSFIQYMPKKPTKQGIKVWVCCDAITGYIYSFTVYTGADPAKPTHPKSLAYDVVMDLMQSRLGISRAVYMDNFYSSPELFEDLLSKGTSSSETVRTNRKQFPTSLKPKPGKKYTRGNNEFLYHNNLTATRCICTFHSVRR